MKVHILNPVRELFNGQAQSVLVPGDKGEFELLDYHAPILSLLRAGHLTIDWTNRIPIKKGILKFDENTCVILVDE
jgi:F0F1-type ATP synthase epsilon subunit